MSLNETTTDSDLSMDIFDILRNSTLEENNTSLAEGFNRMTSSPISKSKSAVSNNSSGAYREDINLSTDSENEIDEVVSDMAVQVTPDDKKLSFLPDDKEITETSSNEYNESTDDEIDRASENSDRSLVFSITEIRKKRLSYFKATRDSNENPRDAIAKSVSSDEAPDETEKIDFGPSTSMTKSKITQNEASSRDEQNTAQMSSSLNVTKRSLEEEHPQESKRTKLVDFSSQTPFEDVDWDEVKNDFFVGVPQIFNLCSCPNHKCDY